MPQDLFLPTPKATPATEVVGVTMKALRLICPDAQSAAVVEIDLAPLTANGEWDASFIPLKVRQEDALFESDLAKRYAASSIIQLMVSAICTGPIAQSLGVEGLTVKDASKVLIPVVLQQQGETQGGSDGS